MTDLDKALACLGMLFFTATMLISVSWIVYKSEWPSTPLDVLERKPDVYSD